MTPSNRVNSHGKLHCGRWRQWHELDAAIIADPEGLRTTSGGKIVPGDLVWVWLCNECGSELGREPFAYPPDMPSTG